jgi:hypothetical protein
MNREDIDELQSNDTVRKRLATVVKPLCEIGLHKFYGVIFFWHLVL